MPDSTSREVRLQPPKPEYYVLPPLVQPNWRLGDLFRIADRELTTRLTNALCACYGVKHCLLLDRARSGLFLLIRAFGLGREWISTSMMHRPSSVLLKRHCEAVAFADVDGDFTIDPASAGRMVSSRTCAILATHTYGKAADVPGLRRLADQRGLFLVENAVHMGGNLSVDGKPLGAWGDATLLSFNVDKPLGALLGGALLTNRDDVWEAIKHFPLGPPNRREALERVMTTYIAYRFKPVLLRLPLVRKHKEAGDGVAEIEQFSANSYSTYNARPIHPVQAAAALACLSREKIFLEKRRRNAELLTAQLCDIDTLVLPGSTPGRPHAFTYYPVVLREGSRFKLGKALAGAGIETKWRYHPLHMQAGFTDCRRDDMTRTEYLWAQHLLLPAGCNTSEAQIAYLARQIHRITSP